MELTENSLRYLVREYGSPLYVFDEIMFIDNYKQLLNTFRNIYENYQIAYSFKTNYTPCVVATIKNLGGYAEVVSEMEYFIAKQVGYTDDKIIFNGPNKLKNDIRPFLNGCIFNIDSTSELEKVIDIASSNESLKFEIGIRVNINVGQDFVSRFGIDITELASVFDLVNSATNVKIVGLHCHISRCRELKAWEKRVNKMIDIADHYFVSPPKYIDLGSGMFGDMSIELASQFEVVPTYHDYAKIVAGKFAEHYRSAREKPILFTEPGATIINRYINFITRVEIIKHIQGKSFAVLDSSIHNLGETSVLKELPIKIYNIVNKNGNVCQNIDLTGYTCLEQDIMRRNLNVNLSEGDYILFENVGGYSNVLKPPFIMPNCAMVSFNSRTGESKIIKRAETFHDVLNTYLF